MARPLLDQSTGFATYNMPRDDDPLGLFGKTKQQRRFFERYGAQGEHSDATPFFTSVVQESSHGPTSGPARARAPVPRFETSSADPVEGSSSTYAQARAPAPGFETSSADPVEGSSSTYAQARAPAPGFETSSADPVEASSSTYAQARAPVRRFQTSCTDRVEGNSSTYAQARAPLLPGMRGLGIFGQGDQGEASAMEGDSGDNMPLSEQDFADYVQGPCSRPSKQRCGKTGKALTAEQDDDAYPEGPSARLSRPRRAKESKASAQELDDDDFEAYLEGPCSRPPKARRGNPGKAPAEQVDVNFLGLSSLKKKVHNKRVQFADDGMAKQAGDAAPKGKWRPFIVSPGKLCTDMNSKCTIC